MSVLEVGKDGPEPHATPPILPIATSGERSDLGLTTERNRDRRKTALAWAGAVALAVWATAAGSPALAGALLLSHVIAGHWLWRRPVSDRPASARPLAAPKEKAQPTPLPAATDHRAAWDATSAGVLLVDAAGRVQWANAAAAKVLGRDRLEGGRLAEIVPTLASDDANGKSPREHVAMTADGTLRPIAMHIDRQGPHEGDERRLVLVVDVTDLRANEHQLLLENNLLQSASMALVDAKVSAEEASRRKTQFLAYASHEIRTPLQAILGFAEQLDEGSLTPDERSEAVRVIRRNGEHLLTVLSDVLDLAGIESDHLEVRFAACDLRREVESVVQLFTVTAKERNVIVEVAESTPLPPTVGTDKTRLRQVLINLVGNAVRGGTTAGGRPARVKISLAALASPPLVRIEVQDEGPCLPDRELQRMFEPFDQAAAVADQRLGTGLGLAISRRLAQLLGGNVVASSTPDAGTTVTFTFDPGPLPPQEAWVGRPQRAAQSSASEARALAGRVLLAEDGRDNRLLIGTILARAGLDVATVEDGASAIAAVAAGQHAGQPFDAIVMDMQMPIMDGYQATRSLRASGCTIPILALTADALADARQRCLDAGCDDYASKPIDRRGLLSTLRRLLDRRPSLAACDKLASAPVAR